MKIFDWILGKNHKYTIHINHGNVEKLANQRWRWLIVDHKGNTIALSPVSGWRTADEATKSARDFLSDIDADYLDIAEEI